MPSRRGQRQSSPWPLWSSWRSVGFPCLAVSQLVSIFLLISLASRKQYDPPLRPTEDKAEVLTSMQDGWQSQSLQQQQRPAALADGEASSRRRRRDRVLSVRSNPLGSCFPRRLSAGRCQASGMSRPEDLKLETCAFELQAADVVFGVWHSLATEARLQPLLDTWGASAQIVLLASTVGVKDSILFKQGPPGSRPHLLDTGIEQDDYFSTLGKAFVGLRLMLEAYPTKKWFVILGDDNYVLLDNYVNALSAFDSERPWALSRMVERQQFGCKVAGGASVITSRAMTQELSPHLDPWYRDIVARSGGNVNNARMEDKFHDIAFQKLVEHVGHSWVHLDELPHEPPGFLMSSRNGVPMGQLPERSALFHYVPGGYMHYLHFTSTQACTCELPLGDASASLSKLAVGVYSPRRRLGKIDEKRIAASWGKDVPIWTRLRASGPEYAGLRGDVARLREMVASSPEVGWLLLLPVEHYPVASNLAARIRLLDRDHSAGRGVAVYGPAVLGQVDDADANPEDVAADGALLVGRDLADTIFSFEDGLLGGLFPYAKLPGDRGIVSWARTLSSETVLEDGGLVRRLPRAGTRQAGAGCPATFPMDADVADLKPEFALSEGEAVMHVSRFLLQAARPEECTLELSQRVEA